MAAKDDRREGGIAFNVAMVCGDAWADVMWSELARSEASVYPTIIAQSYHTASLLPSLVSSSSPEFQACAEAMDQIIADLEAKLGATHTGGGSKGHQAYVEQR